MELKDLMLQIFDRLENLSKPPDCNVMQHAEEEFVKLHSDSQIQIKRNELTKLKAESKSASTFAIALLPKVFTFEQIYRRSIKNRTVNDEFAKVPIDQELLADILIGVTERKGSDVKTVRRDLANHLARLNSAFRSLRDGKPATSAMLNEFQIRIDHLIFSGFPDYIKNRSKFFELDKEIDLMILANERSKCNKQKFNNSSNSALSCSNYQVFNDQIDRLFIRQNMIQVNLQSFKEHLNQHSEI